MEIEVNGVRCHYQDEGKGPVVILLHGFTLQVYTWRDTIPALGTNLMRSGISESTGMMSRSHRLCSLGPVL